VSGALKTLIRTAPVLPSRVKAEVVIARELLDRLHDADVTTTLEALLAAHPQVEALIAGLCAHSPFLTQAMRTDPAGLVRMLEARPEVAFEGLTVAAILACGEEADLATVMRALRVYRRSVALLLALADIGGVWGVGQVTSALTRTADTAVQMALAFALRQAAGLNRVKLADADDPGTGCGLVILALGKHGGKELNYSSDIDIVAFFDPEMAEAAGVAEPASFFVRITQLVARILQERTADGYVFRVDLRLRPDPASTHVAVSLPSAYAYYEQVGQNWERAAYIKARPIAGDIGLGTRFLKDLTPFIWRKYFDFAAIADIHAMKRQIQAVKGHETIAVAGHDVKLGRGGIREIEFFVQTQQLVYGGRRPAVRGARTLDMLAALHVEGWISVQARDELSEAYRFLRTIEHRIQMRHDEQTQRLPADKDDLDNFARFCGYAGTAAFAKALTFQAKRVESHYALLFEDGPSLAAEAGSLSFTGTSDDPETLKTLKRLGFRDGPLAAETVRGWHFGRRPAVTSPRAREVLTELTPALLVALGRTADADAGLATLDRAFERMPAAVELLTLLRSHQALLALFAEILGSAPRLSKVVALHPHVLDTVIDPAFASTSLDADDVTARVRSVVGQPPPSVEDGLDRMRDAARQENFLVGARLLSGTLSPQRAGQAYAAVAEACIRVAFTDVRRAFIADHGEVAGAEVVVLGLGRLGAGELTATSDLDLVVLYDRPADSEASSGPRPLDPVTYHVRLTQRLVSALTVPTRRGTLYQVDLRLRPTGNKGPLGTQFSSFSDYYRDEAEIWEHMALTRARVVAGDAGLGARVRAAIDADLMTRRDPGTVARAVAEMRGLIATEKGEKDVWDLKLAAGGLLDSDFLAQYLVLAHAADCAALLGQDSEGVIRTAGRAGLLAPDDAATLGDACRLFNDVQQWQRFTTDETFDPAKVPQAAMRRIAGAVGLPDGKLLLAHLNATRAAVRVIFGRLLRPTSGQ
jgi:[glutamine synthetase] adenylyltransferase / [glutamine synthetase]-adenylyl-L-tyrosine phosphorylase